MSRIECPHCAKSVGGLSSEGGYRVRLGIVLIDSETGDISGPCPACKATIRLSSGGNLNKSILPKSVVPAFRVSKA